MDKQQRILSCLQHYPAISDKERRDIRDKVINTIQALGINGHLGFDIDGYKENIITFEVRHAIPKDFESKFKDALNAVFNRTDIDVAVTDESNHVQEYEDHILKREYDEKYIAIKVWIPKILPETLGLREVMEEGEYTHNSHDLPLPIGSHIFGEPLVVDLQRLPHILVGGAPGMGKTTVLHNFIISLLNTKAPQELQLVLVNCKDSAFANYSPLSDLYLLPIEGITNPIVDNDKAMVTLHSLNAELDKRYNLLRQSSVLNITEYNKEASSPLPYIVLVIDDYDNIMESYGTEFESQLARLAQLGMAAGIHLIMATAKITNDVITLKLKANFPSRLALKVNSPAESEILLDETGAECPGDEGELFFPHYGTTYNLQAPLVTSNEVKSIAEIVKKYYSCTEI